jgi:hypothetical protein
MGKDKKEKKEQKEKKEKKRVRQEPEEDGESSTVHPAEGERKARKKVEKIARALGYSNETNPFGDSNLLKPFVWGKKQEQEVQQHEDSSVSRISLMKDIERVRERRRKRELEMEEMERLRTEEVRLREASLYGDWREKEEEFHVRQTLTRSELRILEGRPRAIDRIAQAVVLIEAFETRETVAIEIDYIMSITTNLTDSLLFFFLIFS